MVGRMISYPKFDPPMKFVVEKADVVGHIANSIPPTYNMVRLIFSPMRKILSL